MSKSRPTAAVPAHHESRASRREESTPPSGYASRETTESVALAVILAFLFRAFVAEAFVIPTGSMAPTLMGQHKDVQCPECGYWYQAGASLEDGATAQQRGETPRIVVATTCPLCHYRLILDLRNNANQATFSGDRILVSKFVYDFAPPERWDVIVFKYPFDAKQNYIKRLVGLPNEQIRISRGDVFIKGPEADTYAIARKPDHKLKSMLQVVDDTRHISRRLTAIGWPLRWQPWAAGVPDVTDAWSTSDDGHTYDTEAVAGQDIWLRYRHIVASDDDWKLIEDGQQPPMVSDRRSELITDVYAYNSFTSISPTFLSGAGPKRRPEDYADARFAGETLGLYWVSDLALEGDVEVKGDSGELLLLLVKGGTTYTCRIDVAIGATTLAVDGDDGGKGAFVGSDGTRADTPVGQTAIQGRGTYRVRFSNVDAEIRLWVNERRVTFNGPTTYAPRDTLRPVTSELDPGDLAPAGIGTRDVALHIQRLRVLRDVYYVATRAGNVPEYTVPYGHRKIKEILRSPERWPETDLFDMQAEMQITMEAGQLFPLGDNSPQSSDGRMWEQHYVDQDLLIGKALLIYWPHPWYRPIPYLPNFKRMRLIH